MDARMPCLSQRGLTTFIQAFQLHDNRTPELVLNKAAKTATHLLGWATDVVEFAALCDVPDGAETEYERFVTDVFGNKCDDDVGLGLTIMLSISLALAEKKLRHAQCVQKGQC